MSIKKIRDVTCKTHFFFSSSSFHSLSLCVCMFAKVLLDFCWLFFLTLSFFVFCLRFTDCKIPFSLLILLYFFLRASYTEIIIWAMVVCSTCRIIIFVDDNKSQPTQEYTRIRTQTHEHTIKWFILCTSSFDMMPNNNGMHTVHANTYSLTHSLIKWHFFNWTTGNCTRNLPNCLDMNGMNDTTINIYTQ